MDQSDCGICQGYGYTGEEEHTNPCPACKGEGVSSYPEDTYFAVEVVISERKVIWVDAEDFVHAHQSAKSDGCLYEYFPGSQTVEAWWDIPDRTYDIYQEEKHLGPVEMCQTVDGKPFAVPVSMGTYGHSRQCDRFPAKEKV